MPKRIQMSRQHPWRAGNPDAVIVTRPGWWSNPYRVSDVMKDARRAGERISEQDARAQVVAWFRRDVENPEQATPHIAQMVRRVGILRGRDLACWCPLDQPCHADVLLELANEVA